MVNKLTADAQTTLPTRSRDKAVAAAVPAKTAKAHIPNI